MKAILGFTRMTVLGIDKVKSELGFVLMALNVREIVAQRATLFDKNKENDNFYIISIEIIVFCLVRDIYVRTQSLNVYLTIYFFDLILPVHFLYPPLSMNISLYPFFFNILAAR